MEIKINTKFDESDRAFMLTKDDTYAPVEIIQVNSVEHEINAYNFSVFKIVYEVKTLLPAPFKRYSAYEKELYSLEDMENLLLG